MKFNEAADIAGEHGNETGANSAETEDQRSSCKDYGGQQAR
jgi:hypothetical protein